MDDIMKAPRGLIYKKIAAVMADVEAITKDRTNTQGFTFKYRGIDDCYNSLHSVFAKHGVFTVPKTKTIRREEKPTAAGKTVTYTILEVEFTFYCEDGSSVQAVMAGEAMDSGDKGANKAMSIAHKYALMQVLMIPTEDEKDPDSVSHEVRTPITNPGEYVVTFGKKYAGKTLAEIGREAAGSYANYLLDSAAKSGKQVSGVAKEFLDNLDAWIALEKPKAEQAPAWVDDVPTEWDNH